MSGTSARPSGRLVLTDAAVVVAIGLLATSPLADAYGGWRWAVAAGGGLALGLGVAAASMRLRLGPWLTALALLLAYLLLGPALAVPDEAVAGVLPDPDSLRALLTGLVHSWRDSLTLLTPLGSSGTVLVVPYVVGLLTGVLSGLVLWRSRRPGAAALVLIGAFVVAAAFGDRVTDLSLSRGLALTAVLLVWTRWRATRSARVSWPRRLALTAAVLVVAGAAGSAVVAATAGETREVLRDHVDPPFDPQDYPSPLSRFRAFYDEAGLGEKTMFTTTGLAQGDLIRVATMDTFDGIVWNVAGGPSAPSQSGTFERFSSGADGDVDSTTEKRVSITVEDYSGPWLPTVGQTEEVTVSQDGRTDGAARSLLLHNVETGTMAQLGGVRSGATYSFVSRVPENAATPETLGAGDPLAVTPPPEIPALVKRVQKWLAELGSQDGGALAAGLAEQFRQGFYSDGKPTQAASASGHGVKRLSDLMAPDQMIGNAEQYASALGVAAQSQGLGARVVIGFVVPDETGVVHGADVDAWVEVNLDEAGWVAFRPTPDKSRMPKQEQEDPEPEPQPHVLQPPVVPEEPGDSDDKAPQGAGQDVEDDPLAAIRDLLRYVAYGGGVLGLAAPIWVPVLVKVVRRRRRRRAADPLVRVSGGWREVADRARDLGTRLPVSNTRMENGAALVARYPGSDVVGLAALADRHVFGPEAPTDAEVTAYWKDVDTALRRLRRSAPWWRRPLAVVSPVSVPWRRPLRAVGRLLVRAVHASRLPVAARALVTLPATLSRGVRR